MLAERIKMEDKIYLKELQCCTSSALKALKRKFNIEKRGFELSRLPNEAIKNEMNLFIRSRGNTLKLSSMQNEIYVFHELCAFLSEEYPDLATFKSIDVDKIKRKCKVWLLKNGRKISSTRTRPDTENATFREADLLVYINKIYRFFNNIEDTRFDFQKDKWFLDGFPFSIQQNPVKKVRSISFEKILQHELREEVKQVIYIHLSQKAVSSVGSELSALNRFSKFLDEYFKNIKSMQDINRNVIEAYLMYISADKSLSVLKSVFLTAARVLENSKLANLFCADDFPREEKRIYKAYSDAEVKLLNEAIVQCDEQIARALLLHQMLGTRISETLTLQPDSVYQKKPGLWMIKIVQIKTKKSYEKVINEDIKKVFESACAYTSKKYGQRKYVFVSEQNPDEAMAYSRIQYRLRVMIRQKDLRDDHGERFRVGTHIFRHCYGKRLTEMNIDDAVIAKLLGHSSTGSVQYYRRIGDKMLADETREMRCALDELINSYLPLWT